MAALGVVHRAPDGTPLCAACGELPVDVDEQRVQCHLCGGWYRELGSSQLSRTHGVTADEYRELAGLRPRHPLWAPVLIEAHSERLHARLVAEPRLRVAMAKGHALARGGELQRCRGSSQPAADGPPWRQPRPSTRTQSSPGADTRRTAAA